MARNRFILVGSWFVAGLLLAVAGFPARADESVAVSLVNLPAAVQKAVQKLAGPSEVDSINKVTDGRKISYEVSTSHGDDSRDFSVDENGKLLDVEVSLEETPPAVRETIGTFTGKGAIEDITKIIDGGNVSYEVEITRDHKKRSFNVDAKGNLAEFQLFLNEAPEAVQTAIRATLGVGKLGDINKEFDEAGDTYEVTIDPEGKTRTVTFKESGEIVSDEAAVALAETPDAVQKAVKEELKAGELGGITKNTDADGVTYDVEMKIEDKWETVTLGKNGKVVE